MAVINKHILERNLVEQKEIVDIVIENKAFYLSSMISTMSLAAYTAITLNHNNLISIYNAYLTNFWSICVVFYFLIIVLFVSIKKIKDSKGALIENKKGKKYFLHAGWETKKHYNNIKNTVKKLNRIRPLLLSEVSYTKHWAIIGSTGSGKTVTMQYLMQKSLEKGSGFLFLDGKGSRKMIKDIMALTWEYGRESDFHLLNFSNPNNSQSINLFTLKREQLQEVVNFIMTKSEEPWLSKGVELGTALVNIISPFQKLNIAMNVETFDDIKTYQDLKTKSNKIMTFKLFRDYMQVDNQIKMIRMLRRVEKDKKFLKDYYKVSDQIGESKTKPSEFVLNFLQAQSSGVTKDDIINENMSFDKISEKAGDDPWYNIDVAKQAYSKAMSMLGDTYGNIFNSSTPEIDLEDIILNQKIIYVVLPGTKSSETSSMFAKVILGQIVAMYEKAKDRKPLKTPFSIFLDEFNSWAFRIEGLGNLLSQTREQKLSFLLGFQSDLDKTDEGKGFEKEQLFANINNYVILKTQSPQLIKYFQENFPKKKIMKQNDNLYIQNADTQDKEDIQMEEKNCFEQEDLENLAPGECYFKFGAEVIRGCTQYTELPEFLEDDEMNDIEEDDIDRPLPFELQTKITPQKLLSKQLY